jgi:hypothetical protein
MATIIKEILIEARPDDVWDAVRDFGEVHAWCRVSSPSASSTAILAS